MGPETSVYSGLCDSTSQRYAHMSLQVNTLPRSYGRIIRTYIPLAPSVSRTERCQLESRLSTVVESTVEFSRKVGPGFVRLKTWTTRTSNVHAHTAEGSIREAMFSPSRSDKSIFFIPDKSSPRDPKTVSRLRTRALVVYVLCVSTTYRTGTLAAALNETMMMILCAFRTPVFFASSPYNTAAGPADSLLPNDLHSCNHLYSSSPSSTDTSHREDHTSLYEFRVSRWVKTPRVSDILSEAEMPT
jgi:hypothetical protein